MASSKKAVAAPTVDTISPEAMKLIEKAIQDIYHGSVTLIVQDSRVIQIEKHEKIRLC